MKNNNNSKYLIFFILSISMILTGCTSSAPGKYDGLAKCLTEKGATMYGTEWCSHCQNQKKMFGKSFEYIIFVDCDVNQNSCIAAGVEGYPTWKINNTNYAGEQSLYKLSQASGCPMDVSSE